MAESFVIITIVVLFISRSWLKVLVLIIVDIISLSIVAVL